MTSYYDHQKAIMDIDYSARLYELHARLYRRLKSAFLFISMFGSTSVAVLVIGDQGTLAVAVSVLLAAIPILDVVIAPGDKALWFDCYRKRFLSLRVAAYEMPASEVNRKLHALHSEPCDEIESLRRVAFNDNLCAHGGDDGDAFHLTRLQRLVGWLA